MFTRLFKRQSSSSPAPVDNKDGGTKTSTSKAATHNQAESAPEDSLLNCLRVLICQDIGDKRKLPLLDTAHDQANYSQTVGRHHIMNGSLPKPVPDHPGDANHRYVGEGSGSISRGRYRGPLGGQGDERRSGFRGAPGGRRKSVKNLDLLGEMMFGAVPLSPKGVTTKVHYFRAPNAQVLLTKVFTMPADITEEEEDTITASLLAHTRLSSVSSSYSTWGDAFSDVGDRSRPLSRINSFSRSFQPGVETSVVENSYSRPVSWISDGGRYSISPTPSFVSSLWALTEGSESYRRRKIERFSMHSAERSSDISLSSSPSAGGLSSPLKKTRRRIAYSVALVLDCGSTPELRDFFFTHYILIERHLLRLQKKVLGIILDFLHGKSQELNSRPPSSDSWATMTTDASDAQSWFTTPYALQGDVELVQDVKTFRNDIQFLFETPRLKEPLWLDMLTFSDKRKTMAQSLITNLCELMKSVDLAKTNLFLSEVLTSVLAHHLAWTGTVASVIEAKGCRSGAKCMRVDGPPYNPYLAQLSDLYGSIGAPPKSSRTIIIGRRKLDMVRKLLSILSYFMRCGEVIEDIQNMEPWTDVSSAPSESFTGYLELPLARTSILRTIPDPTSGSPALPLHRFSYARSLLGDACSRYGPDFALMAVPALPDMATLKADLQFLSEVSSGPAAMVCVNIDDNTCQVAQYTPPSFCSTDFEVKAGSASPLITDMLKGLYGLWACRLPAETCVTFLEDQLQEIYNKSILLSVTLASNPSIGFEALMSLLGVHRDDMQLLLPVASTFDENIEAMLEQRPLLSQSVRRPASNVS
ncbi:hypothetical protein SpCBS45565_g01576 [Spizellomyces sp. 'palustris']|nr:hypothetical protein SpCBS45565_g01576 [Spizellomyces sp. 'palustris']